MPVFEMVFVLILAALAWLWLDSLKAREIAIRTARAACSAEALMLLDDTVAICGLKAVRNEDGRLRLQRAYEFEYTDNGDNRLKGSVILLGHQVTLLNVGLRDTPAVRTLH